MQKKGVHIILFPDSSQAKKTLTVLASEIIISFSVILFPPTDLYWFIDN